MLCVCLSDHKLVTGLVLLVKGGADAAALRVVVSTLIRQAFTVSIVFKPRTQMDTKYDVGLLEERCSN